MINLITTIGISIAVLAVILAISWYRLVPPSEAHIVVRSRSKFLVCTDKNVKEATGTNSYFKIPVITTVRILDITIKELKHSQLTWEKNLARFLANWSLKYHIQDPIVASSKYINDDELAEQLVSVIEAGVNAVCSKYDIQELRSKKKDMEKDIKDLLEENLNSWGVSLVNFQLVDFQDTKDSRVITDLSLVRETEISSKTRQVNAEQIKLAEMKESEARQLSATRRIEAEEAIGKREQDKAKTIAEQEKEAKIKAFEVISVETVKQAEIVKEQAIIQANQHKETTLIEANLQKEQAVIKKEQQRLEGEGERLKTEEIAKGNAEKIKQEGFAFAQSEAKKIKDKGQAESEVIELKGLAEAKSKDELQKALNKFSNTAVSAMVAEAQVSASRDVGVEQAKALQQADIKIFNSGTAGQQGIDIGQLLKGVEVVSPHGMQSILDRIATPNLLINNKSDNNSTPVESETPKVDKKKK